MIFHTLHCTRRLRLAAILCLFAGCWQEIEYHEDEPVADAAAMPTNAEPTAVDEPAAAETTSEILATTNAANSVVGDRYSAGGAFTTAEPPIESAVEPEVSPEADAQTVSATMEGASPTSVVSTRLAAWLLGSRLGLAALAHDRNVAPTETVTWLNEARSMASRLNTEVNDLPPRPATAGSGPASREVLSYLLSEGKRIGGELATNHGPEHASIFEVALKSNLLLVLNEPGSAAVGHISAAIERAAPQAKLPEELWRPLLDSLTNQSPPAAVRTAVREMHANVDRHLGAEAEQ
jgi:hypothetical protein